MIDWKSRTRGLARGLDGNQMIEGQKKHKPVLLLTRTGSDQSPYLSSCQPTRKHFSKPHLSYLSLLTPDQILSRSLTASSLAPRFNSDVVRPFLTRGIPAFHIDVIFSTSQQAFKVCDIIEKENKKACNFSAVQIDCQMSSG